MTVQLELLPQGGLGNQLIQYAYAQSLATRSGATVEVNPVLLGRTWARLRGVSFRPLSPWLADYWPVVQGRRRRGMNLMLSKVHRLLGHQLAETLDDADLVQALATAPRQRRVWLLGYNQHQQAFSSDALPLWRHVAEGVRGTITLSPRPIGHVAMHVRLGDYLLPQNQRLFALLPVQELVTQALNWREQLGASEHISVFTDSPSLLADQLEQVCTSTERAQLRIESHGTAEADFVALLQHRHIVASNSTFSLCAGQLSWVMWGESAGAPLLLPGRWYCDQAFDRQQRQEWEACSFTRTTL